MLRTRGNRKAIYLVNNRRQEQAGNVCWRILENLHTGLQPLRRWQERTRSRIKSAVPSDQIRWLSERYNRIPLPSSNRRITRESPITPLLTLPAPVTMPSNIADHLPGPVISGQQTEIDPGTRGVPTKPVVSDLKRSRPTVLFHETERRDRQIARVRRIYRGTSEVNRPPSPGTRWKQPSRSRIEAS